MFITTKVICCINTWGQRTFLTKVEPIWILTCLPDTVHTAKQTVIKMHVILSMQLQPGRVLYAVKNDPPVEYSISFITNTL